ncbi:MAG: hypothetical protein Q9N67_00925 [Ghiorsea sp.]|nr:hypothetical protein [Ghiorsea sp.]
MNADLIAAGLSPLAPERELIAASRIFLSEIEEHIAGKRGLCFWNPHFRDAADLRLIQLRCKAEGLAVSAQSEQPV